VPEAARLVLDLGCGAGCNAQVLASRGVQVDGVTLSESERARAAQWCHRCWVHDLESGLPSGLEETYDAVVCSHVLEHLRWPDRALAALRPLLIPGRGCLLVALPNLLFYKTRARLLIGRFEYQDSGIMDASHFRWYTFATARRLVEQAGFTVCAHEVQGSAPIPLIRRYLPAWLTAAADRLAERTLPGFFGGQIIIAATPRD
jgi:2-polyprenyl-3-methyl-5-hydroxy-6-metoxy-1,4-benzoquinol methylase